jgi:chemotaxis signal transduction protein
VSEALLDIALDAPAAAQVAAPADVAPIALAPPTERAQAVRCGERWIALPYGWARQAVEQAALSAVPGAPAWLAGAANVEGRVVPVIDLPAWLHAGQFTDARAKDTRVLVGGDGDDMVGLLFTGLPRLVHVTRDTSEAAAADDRLAPYRLGRDPEDASTVAIDAAALVAALIDELALL